MTRWILPLLVIACGTAIAFGAVQKVRATAPARVAASPSQPPAGTQNAEARGLSLQADRQGHFQAHVVVDGRGLRMLVDTGATLCAFSQEDAEQIGIRVNPSDFRRSSMTANGVVLVAPVRIAAIQIGPILVRDVEAVVVPRGRLGTSLLGMSFLKRVREFNIADGHLTLRS